MVIAIDIDTRRVERMLRGYQRTIPNGARMGMWRSAQRFQKEMRREVKAQGLVHTGKLLSGIRARRLSRNSYGVFVPKHGIDLDSMRPHFVSLKRGRKIRQWYAAKVGGSFPRAIFVKPHPWVQRPVLKAQRQVKRIIEKEINRRIRRKGK